MKPLYNPIYSAEYIGEYRTANNIPDDMLRFIAANREESHKNTPSSKPLSEDFELVGLAGEREFSKQYGIPMCTRLGNRGDGGIDFIFNTRSLDVKTSAKWPRWLLVEPNKHLESGYADIYVLAKANIPEPWKKKRISAHLLGWMPGDKVKLRKREWFGPMKPHKVDRRDLLPMYKLQDYVNGQLNYLDKIDQIPLDGIPI